MLAALDETERSERVDLQGQDPRSPLLIPCVALTLSKREPVTGGSSGMLLLRRLEQGPGEPRLSGPGKKIFNEQIFISKSKSETDQIQCKHW